MPHDWSARGPKGEAAKASPEDRFPFWSRAEVARVGLIAALAALPLSVTSFGPPSATARGAKLANPVAIQAGQLRAVRIVNFDLKNLTSSALADAD